MEEPENPSRQEDTLLYIFLGMIITGLITVIVILNMFHLPTPGGFIFNHVRDHTPSPASPQATPSAKKTSPTATGTSVGNSPTRTSTAIALAPKAPSRPPVASSGPNGTRVGQIAHTDPHSVS